MTNLPSLFNHPAFFAGSLLLVLRLRGKQRPVVGVPSMRTIRAFSNNPKQSLK
jgi:hypothetical protein